MGQVLHRGLLQGRESVGGGRIMGAEARVHNKLAEVRGFAESDRGGFDEEVLGGWIRGEDVEAFSKDLFEAGLHCYSILLQMKNTVFLFESFYYSIFFRFISMSLRRSPVDPTTPIVSLW